MTLFAKPVCASASASGLGRRRVLSASVGWAMGGVAAQLAPLVWAKADRLKVTVALDNRAALPQLPLLLADQLGLFRLEQLEVDFVELGSDARVVQAVQGGPQGTAVGPAVEVGSAGFADMLSRVATGPSLQAFVALSTAPLLAFGVAARGVAPVRDLAELRGRTVAVPQGAATASATVRLTLERAGVAASEVQWLGLPDAASLGPALRSGQVQAACLPDPKATLLEQSGDWRVLADARSRSGSQALFGGLLPASVLVAQDDWLKRHNATAQALSHGVVRALKWLQTAGLGDIIKTVPESYFGGDRALYLSAFAKARNSFAADGLIPPDVSRTGPRALRAVDVNARLDRFELVRSYTNQFARLAKARFDA